MKSDAISIVATAVAATFPLYFQTVRRYAFMNIQLYRLQYYVRTEQKLNEKPKERKRTNSR